MHKKICICLLVLFFSFLGVLLKSVDVSASENDIELLQDFQATHASFCYLYEQVVNENSANPSINVELSLIIYEGFIGENDAYVLYNRYTNEIVEYNLNSHSLWDLTSRSLTEAVPVYISSNIHLIVNWPKVLVLENFSLEHNSWIEYPEFANLFAPITLIDLNEEPFDVESVIVNENTVENDFYFENLNLNFGDNVFGSCAYVSMAMILSYYNEFYDQSIIPEVLSYTTNEYTNSILKSNSYNYSYDNKYNISQMESPGANDNFHNFLIEYGSKYVLEESDLVYGLYEDQVKDIFSSYINDFYDNSKLQTRYVTDDRVLDDEYSYDFFEEDYEYYESQTNEQLLFDSDGIFEYELDICKEIDNGNPVLLFLNDFFSPYSYYSYLENYNGTLDNVMFSSYQGHAVVAYGYVVTEHQIFYKCHMGWKSSDNRYDFNEVYVTTDAICTGIVLKDFSEEDEFVEDSSYVYENNGCKLFIPTNKLFNSLSELAIATKNIDFDTEQEYYYCDCEVGHVLYQRNHIFNYHENDTSTHIKYCSCGYSLIENHDIYHETTGHGHYELCEKCDYYNAHADGVTYTVLEEISHSWSCSICNSSGIINHEYIFTPLDNNIHMTTCSICEYENYVPHGIEFDMWYIRIDNLTHIAHCSCCGQEWIESHIENCWCNY